MCYLRLKLGSNIAGAKSEAKRTKAHLAQFRREKNIFREVTRVSRINA